MADEKTAYRYLEEIGLEPIEHRAIIVKYAPESDDLSSEVKNFFSTEYYVSRLPQPSRWAAGRLPSPEPAGWREAFLKFAWEVLLSIRWTDYNKTPDQPHPVLAAMNYMKFDAMTLGNHEFNYGIPNMLKIMGQAEFPVLAANVLDAGGKYVTGEGWTIIERGGVKLAVIVLPSLSRVRS